MKNFLLAFFLLACSVPQSEDQRDKKYADVFKSLDGTWKGKFYVYSTRQSKGKIRPRNISKSYLDSLKLKTEMIINVTQHYTSDNSYYQRVNIEDQYEDGEVVKSSGVNKVENGKLWCIVNKPDGQVKHVGLTDGEQTILWETDNRSPLKVEFFRETVTDSSYTIIGWGYYGDDDPEKSPRTWFWGDYKRQF